MVISIAVISACVCKYVSEIEPKRVLVDPTSALNMREQGGSSANKNGESANKKRVLWMVVPKQMVKLRTCETKERNLVDMRIPPFDDLTT